MPHSFFVFLEQMISDPVLMITSLLTMSVLLVNGWTDAPNAIAGAVLSGALPFRKAVLLAAVCNFLGVLCITAVNSSVAQTVYAIARFSGGPGERLTALCAAMFAIVLWAGAAWWFGIPTSESHALTAGITGAAIALEGSLSCVRWDSWGKVFLGLLLSALAGTGLGQAARQLLARLPLPSGALNLFQIPAAAALAFLHGAQDGQKFLGVFLLGTALAQGHGPEAHPFIPPWLMVLCAGLMALGTLMGGRRIIDKLGRGTAGLSQKEGVAADLGSMVCLSLATWLGLPVSTTHTRTCALLGSGRCVDRAIAGQLLSAWLLTFPSCLAIGYMAAKLFLSFLT